MICPNCIELLVKNKKKLGEVNNWLVCPKCGYRTRECIEREKQFQQRFQLSQRIKENNLTGGKHEEQP